MCLEKGDCSICLNSIKGDETILKCKHMFHRECINKWILEFNHGDCPECRTVIDRVNDLDVNPRISAVTLVERISYCVIFCFLAAFITAMVYVFRN